MCPMEQCTRHPHNIFSEPPRSQSMKYSYKTPLKNAFTASNGVSVVNAPPFPGLIGFFPDRGNISPMSFWCSSCGVQHFLSPTSTQSTMNFRSFLQILGRLSARVESFVYDWIRSRLAITDQYLYNSSVEPTDEASVTRHKITAI